MGRNLHIVQDKFPDRIPLTACKQVLNAEGGLYSDEEILQIRDMLYALADIDYNYYLEHKNEVEVNKSSDG